MLPLLYQTASRFVYSPVRVRRVYTVLTMQRSTVFLILIVLAAILASMAFLFVQQSPDSQVSTITPQDVNTNVGPAPTTTNTPAKQPASAITYPIDDFFGRITKKHFGQYITPTTSPVQPERFTGYHTGVDCETTPEKADIDVPVYAIADGTIVYRSWVNGYGGVAMTRHEINGETITALYGHVRLSSITHAVDDIVSKGEQIAVLGAGGTTETDGERKHLHFDVLKGDSTDVRGYVQDESSLAAWINPEELLR